MPGLKCPHCGSSTSYSPVISRKQVERERGNFIDAKLATGSIYDIKKDTFYALSRCRACDEAFILRGKTRKPDDPDEYFDDDSLEALWPVRYRPVADELPPSIKEAMVDASAALGAGSIIGSSLALRTAMIRALRNQKQKLGLEEATLKILAEKGVISKTTYIGGDVARRVAGYLGHDEPDPEKPWEREEVEELYEFVDALLDELYVKTAKIKKYQERLKKKTGQGKDAEKEEGSTSG